MKLETFFSNFELFADAPNGVQKLRELILQLAVQGKLVPQNPEDEPAAVLLEKIKQEKERLVKEGKIKKSKKLPSVDVGEMAFDLPEGWEWVRLGEITEKLGAGSTPKGGKQIYQQTGIKFLRSQNVWNDGLRLENVAYIPLQIHQRMNGTHVKPGDILLNITGASIGRSSVVPDDFDEGNVSQHVAIVRLVNKSIRFFIHISLISPYIQDLIMGVQVGISREGLSMSSLKDFSIPLPPLNEAKCIVTKVDALMKLCDELETRSQNKRDRILKLGQVATTKLTTPSSKESFNQHWKTISDNFDLLYSIPENVKQLRQAILQLAVMGKLVPQNPDDEPAAVLLEKIKAEKERLVKEGKIKKSKELPSVDVGEMAFELPQGWEWCYVSDISFKVTDGEHITPKRTTTGYYLLSARNVRDEGIVLDKVDYVPLEEFERIKKRCNPEKNDILISCSGSVGRVAIVDKDNAYVMVRSVALLKPFHNYLYSYYLAHLLKSTLVQKQIIEKSKASAQSNLFLGKIKEIKIVLPPLNEQHRIVTKVNQMMCLCDELEAKLTQSIGDRDKLMSAAVRQVLAV